MAGAAGYLLKNVGRAELLRAIRASIVAASDAAMEAELGPTKSGAA